MISPGYRNPAYDAAVATDRDPSSHPLPAKLTMPNVSLRWLDVGLGLHRDSWDMINLQSSGRRLSGLNTPMGLNLPGNGIGDKCKMSLLPYVLSVVTAVLAARVIKPVVCSTVKME
jgi:hypothetical protein